MTKRRAATTLTAGTLALSLTLFLSGCGAGTTPTATASQPVQAQTLPTTSMDTWRQQVIYLLLPDRFYNGSTANDNAGQPNCYDPANVAKFHGGDIAGLRQKISYLKDLGATAIWTTPVYKQVGITSGPATTYGDCGYHGYWADFNQAGTADVEPKLGTSAELTGLITDLHNNGMKYIMDMVVNHSGYGAQITTQQPTWFHSNCTGDDIVCPLAGLPDFKQEDPSVATYLTNLSKTWASAYQLDGIRMDTVKHVPMNYWQTSWVPSVLSARPGMFLVGEALIPDDVNALKSYVDAGFDATFNFYVRKALVDSLGKGGSMDTLAGRMQDTINTYGLDKTLMQVNLLDNHDVPRFLNEPGLGVPETEIRTRYTLALGALMTLPGIPQLYYGNELGMYGAADHDGRKDMPGWTWTDATRNTTATNFLAGGGTPRDTYNYTKTLIGIRQGNAALWKGSYTELWRPNGGQNVYAYFRGSGTNRIVTIINSSATTANINLDLQGNAGISSADKAAMLDGTTFTNLISNGTPTSATAASGKLPVSIPAGKIAIYRVATSAPAVNVTYQVTASTYYGQSVYLVGDRNELGAWNTAAAIPMTSSNCTGSTCTWKATVGLPPSVATQFKFIKKPGDNGASVTWEGGNNRTYTNPSSGSSTYNGGNWQ